MSANAAPVFAGVLFARSEGRQLAQEIVIKIGLDVSDLDGGVQRVKKTLVSALDAVTPEARQVGRKIGDALSAGIEEGVRQARRLRAELDSALSPVQRHRAAETAENAHTQKITQIRERSAATQATIEARKNAQIDVIQSRAEARTVAHEQRLVEIEKRGAQKRLETLNGLGGQLKSAGQALTAAISLPIAAAGAAVLKIGLEYERSLNTLAAVTTATAAEMAAASKVAKQLGADITLPATSAADAARAMVELAKGGLSIAQAMDAARGTLQLAAAAQIEEAKAAEILANALNAFKLPATEATRIADLLAAASNASSAEITDFGLALQQTSAAAATLKIPIQDTITGLGLLANAGIKGSDAGTSLKTALLALSPNSTKAAEAMKSLGVNAFDASGALLPLRDVIGQFSTAFAKLSDEQRLQSAKTIFGTDAMRAALIVFGGGVEQFDKLSQAVNRQGAAQDLAAAKTKGLSGAYENLKSQLETGAIIVFERLEKPLEKIVRFTAEGISKAIDFAETLAVTNPQLVDLVLTFTGVAAVIGPITLAIGGLISAIGAISGPVLAVVAVVTAAAAAIAAAWSTNFLGIQEKTFAAFEAIRKVAGDVLNYLVSFYRENLPIFKEAIVNVLNFIREFWAEHGASITKIVKETWDIVSTIISTVAKNVLDVLKIIAQLINGDVAGAFSTFAGIVKRSFDAALDILASFAARAFETFKLFGSVILNAGKNAIVASFKLGGEIVSGIVNGIKSKLGDVANIAKEMGKGAIVAARAILESRSPSQVFYKIGVDTAEGYALGLEASKNRVRTATKDLIKAGIADLPDPDKILAEIERTRREADNRRNFALDQVVPFPGFNPSAIGAETLPKTLDLEEIESAIPPLTAAADAVRRFGAESVFAAQSVSPLQNAFSGLIDSASSLLERGIDTLSRKVGIFGGFVKSVLSSVAQSLLSGLGNVLSSRGGLGGFIGNLFGKLTGNGQASAVGSFFTGGFAGGNPAAALTGNGSGGFASALAQSFGLGPSAPPSLSSPIGNLSGLFRSGNPGGVGVFTQDVLTGGSQLGGGGLFGNLFSGIGFGKAPGSGGALAGALPLLGASLGSLVGSDRLTSILGGVAGGLLGVGLSAAPAIIGAGGALSGLGFLAPLFSNPITAIAAGLALPAIFLLGRARQRRRDESSSGDFLKDAIDQIRDVRRQVESNELTLTVGEARKLFESQILQPFVAQINTLKTKSVRESRLKNQTVDLRNLFEKEVIPAVQAQKARAGVSDKLIPEFATGGMHYGVGLALLHHGEAILNLQQQANLRAIAGNNVLQAIGVPNAPVASAEGSAPAFASGGIFRASTRADAPSVNIIVDEVHLFISEEQAGQMVFVGARTEAGQAGLVAGSSKARLNRLTRN